MHWRELSTAPPAIGEIQAFRVTHPFHPLHGRTFQLVDCRQTWGEDRVYFHDDSGQLARLPLQWTDVVPDDPTVKIGAGPAHFPLSRPLSVSPSAGASGRRASG